MLQIKQDDKFFSRVLSKDQKNSKAESSFRFLYYGKSSGSVPFTWESKPGTPKHPLSHSSLPPLTPPPSFKFSSNTPSPRTKLIQNGTSKSNSLFTIFQRKSSKKSHVSPSFSSPSVSSSCSSGSYSASSTPTNPLIHRSGRLSRSRSTGRFGIDRVDHEAVIESPTSSSCLGGRHCFFRQFSVNRSKVNVKYPS